MYLQVLISTLISTYKYMGEMNMFLWEYQLQAPMRVSTFFLCLQSDLLRVCIFSLTRESGSKPQRQNMICWENQRLSIIKIIFKRLKKVKSYLQQEQPIWQKLYKLNDLSFKQMKCLWLKIQIRLWDGFSVKHSVQQSSLSFPLQFLQMARSFLLNIIGMLD